MSNVADKLKHVLLQLFYCLIQKEHLHSSHFLQLIYMKRKALLVP